MVAVFHSDYPTVALSLRLALFIPFRPAGQLFNSLFQVALVISRIGMSNLLGFSLLESGASASRCAQCDASCVALLSPVGHTGWAGGGKPVRSQVRLLLLATLTPGGR